LASKPFVARAFGKGFLSSPTTACGVGRPAHSAHNCAHQEYTIADPIKDASEILPSATYIQRSPYAMPRIRQVALIYDAKLPYDVKVMRDTVLQ